MHAEIRRWMQHMATGSRTIMMYTHVCMCVCMYITYVHNNYYVQYVHAHMYIILCASMYVHIRIICTHLRMCS